MWLENNEDKVWLLGFDHEGQDVFMKKYEVALDYILRRKEAMLL